MNGRRRRRYRIRILRGDVLMVMLLVSASVVACAFCPEKAVADIVIPSAALVAFVAWRISER
jgi:hypothetical protein